MIGVVRALSAQGAPGSQPSEMAQLLTEVRGLRAELAQAAGASVRMQVLVARLTLEEQRINTLGRQLTDVQNEIASTIRERQDTEAGLKQTEESIARGTVPIERQRDIDYMLADMKKLLSQRQEREQQLRAKESEVSGLMASEQGRWADFNERLDELEQSLSRAVPTR